MNFGENFKKLRKQKGMSQKNSVEMLDVSRQAISKWESNTAYLEIIKLIAMSDLFPVKGEKGARNNGVNS